MKLRAKIYYTSFIILGTLNLGFYFNTTKPVYYIWIDAIILINCVWCIFIGVSNGIKFLKP